MSDLISLQQRQAEAEQIVRRFVRRFEPSYHALACHAALPLVLTPELVNYLRNEFLRNEEVPWVAEVDLLLSDLCRPVGYELYAMDTDVRAYLLAELERQFGRSRIQQVAKLLISYVRYLAETGDSVNEKELEAQQWAAMVYINENQRQAAVQQIAEKFRAGGVFINQVGGDLVNPAELARLAQITTELAPELANYPDLLDYAALVSEVILGDDAVDAEQVERGYEISPGIELNLPEQLVRRVRDRIITTQTNSSLSQNLRPEVDQVTEHKEDFPPLQSEIINIVNIEFKAEPAISDTELVLFTFQAGKLKRDHIQKNVWKVNRKKQQAQRYSEQLDGNIFIDMVAIPSGSFSMGSPQDEPDRFKDESPQHEVLVSNFFMSQYPITQAQWRAIAILPEINRKLALNPSKFKGEDHPVECVSWHDAIEFCARISSLAGRKYRLPTESEWEYSCRSKTKSPFHFGYMITSDIANYNGTYSYEKGPKGKKIEKTTPVNCFEIANAFGLSDMHGNVFEWCQDNYDNSYKGAPADGTAREYDYVQGEGTRIIRGGAWNSLPKNCRSAYRISYDPHESFDFIGFRIAVTL